MENNPIKATETTAIVPAADTTSLERKTMWNDKTLLSEAYKAATFLSRSALVPDTYQGKPDNCLIALDIANRTGLSPIMVMQNLYVVKGKPSWSGSFCIAAINGCGKFSPLEFVYVDDGNGGCFARAIRNVNGAECRSETITMQMAANEGWLNKPGSKWKTMPRQMMMYRAAAFFARAHCPEVLLGIQTVEEVQDVKGYDDEKKVVTISLDDVTEVVDDDK